MALLIIPVLKRWSRARGPYGYFRTWNWPITTRKISQPYNKAHYHRVGFVCLYPCFLQTAFAFWHLCSRGLELTSVHYLGIQHVSYHVKYCSFVTAPRSRGVTYSTSSSSLRRSRVQWTRAGWKTAQATTSTTSLDLDAWMPTLW